MLPSDSLSPPCLLSLLLSFPSPPSAPSADVGITLYMGSPLAAIAGAWLAGARALSIFRKPVPALTTAFEVELRARFVLHDALWGSPTARIALGARSTIAGGGAALASTNANAAAAALIDAASPHGGIVAGGMSVGNGMMMTGGLHGMAGGAGMGLGGTTARGMGGMGSAGGAGAGAFGGGSSAQPALHITLEQATQVMAHGGAHQVDGIDRADVVRLLVPCATLEQMRALYGSASSRLNRSAWVQLFQSRFMGVLGNRSRQMAALLAAERRSPALDVAFLIFQVRATCSLRFFFSVAVLQLRLPPVRACDVHRSLLRR